MQHRALPDFRLPPYVARRHISAIAALPLWGGVPRLAKRRGNRIAIIERVFQEPYACFAEPARSIERRPAILQFGEPITGAALNRLAPLTREMGLHMEPH